MKKQKKLVEAFKTFMEKGVIPFLQEDHAILNEWRFLSGILTLQPIDQNQIDFYLLMANKNQHKTGKTSLETSPKEQESPSKQTSYEQTNNTLVKQHRASNKKILASMQSFQGLMVKNQQKLETIAKKDMNGSKADVNTSIQGKKNN